MTDTIQTNGNGDLPPARVAVIDQAQRIHQEVAHQRDMLLRREADLMTEIAGLKAQLSIAELTASQLQNRMDSTTAVRDEAVARKVEAETVLGSMMAIGRAYQIQNEPLVRETQQDIAAIGGA